MHKQKDPESVEKTNTVPARVLAQALGGAGLTTVGIAGLSAVPTISTIRKLRTGRRAVRENLRNHIERMIRTGQVMDDRGRRVGVHLKRDYPTIDKGLWQAKTLLKRVNPAAKRLFPITRDLKLASGLSLASLAALGAGGMLLRSLFKEAKKEKYAKENPKYVRTYFSELKQHGVPFRTRMQWLSRIYGGRGGYTSEELYKIATGKTVGAYYIFPFVKGAPPEVNRILERTYRRHREVGDSKVAAAIAAWTKVKQSGYVKVTKPTPIWVKRKKGRYKMLRSVQLYTAGPRRKGKPRTEEERRKRHKKLHPMKKLPSRGTGLDYGIGRGLGAMTERGVRGLWRTARRHPRVVGAAGAFGAGVLTQKELEKRRKKRIPRYQLEHFTPNIPAATLKERIKGFRPREVLKQRLAESKLTGKTVMRQTSKALTTGARLALVTLVARELLNHLSRKGPMPEIRPDIELSSFNLYENAIQYAASMPNPTLQAIKVKGSAALRKTRKGAERGMLLWLLGFISAELLARGLTSPKKRHEVTFPAKGAYAKMLPGRVTTTPRGRALVRKLLASVTGAPDSLKAIREESGSLVNRSKRLRERIQNLNRSMQRGRPTRVIKSKQYTRIGETGERLPRSGFQPFRPTKTVREVLPKFKRPHRVRRGATVAAIPVAALLALRMSKRREGYAIGQRKTPGRQMGLTTKDVAVEAATRVRKAAGQAKWGFKRPKTVGAASKIAKGTIPRPALAGAFVRRRPGTVAGVGLSLLALQALRRKRKKRKQEGYSFRTAASKVARGASKVGGKVGRGLGAVSNIAIPAMIVSELWPRKRKLQPHPPVQTTPRYTSNNLVEMYPMKSQAQRRWMHAVKPKMAKKWEKETPEGAELPEKVSKHLLGVPVVTLALIERLLNKRRSKRKKYAYPVTLVKNIRELSRLHKSKVLGLQALKWFRDQATRMRTLESAAQPGQKVSIGGHFVGAKPWFKRAGDQWETAGAQVKDMLARGQLEKVKVAAAAAAATGVVGHEVGKQRERARIRKAVG